MVNCIIQMLLSSQIPNSFYFILFNLLFIYKQDSFYTSCMGLVGRTRIWQELRDMQAATLILELVTKMIFV